MSTLRWSLQLGRNVFFVPVIPGRVSFAILAARAFKEWDEEVRRSGDGCTDGRDVVAVSLPECIEDEYMTALSGLPRPSVLFLRCRAQEGDEYRELISVSPTDGFTEAARQAQARKCGLRFIDMTIDPSQLLRDCGSAFPQSFDDGIVLSAGVRDFLNSFEHFLSKPPIRRDPADSLREAALVRGIQKLAPVCRRLFVFCSAPLLQNIEQMLSYPQLHPPVSAAPPDLPTVSRYWAAEQEILRNLDDFPFFAEFYEEQRSHPLFPDLDRMRFVQECLLHTLHSDSSDRVSVRRLGVLMTYLQSLCRSTDRCSPGHQQVVGAIHGALPKGTAQRILGKLYSFGSELNVKAEVTSRGSLSLISRRQRLPIDDIRVARRDCSSNWWNGVEVVTKAEGERVRPGEERDRSWSPTDFHMERLEKIRQRILKIAVLQGTGTTSQEFRGSLEDGIDLRRSVRSVVRDENVFVRARSRGLRASEVRNSPVVWILKQCISANIATNIISSDEFPSSITKVSNINRQDEYVRYHSASLGQRITHVYNGPEFRVLYHEIVGWAAFAPFVGNLNPEILLGAKLEERLPNHRTMLHPAGIGCLDPALASLVDHCLWDEVLLLTACKYAQRCVILVAAADYNPSDRVRLAMIGRKVILLRVNAEVLSGTERFWLSRKPSAQGDTRNVPRERFATEIWPALERQWAE